MLANATVNSSWTKVKIQKEEPRTYWVDSITRPLDKISAQYSFPATGTGHWSGYETRKEGRKDEVKSSMYRRELKSAPYRNWNRFILPINDADIYPRCKEAKILNCWIQEWNVKWVYIYKAQKRGSHGSQEKHDDLRRIACAPSARALNISGPVRTPESKNTWSRPERWASLTLWDLQIRSNA